MIEFFSIENIMATIFGYELSYIEASAILVGILSAYYSVRNSIWTWYYCIIQGLLFFALFYQVQLYASVIIQLFFFGVALYAIWYWKRKDERVLIKRLDGYLLAQGIFIVMLAMAIFGHLNSVSHQLFPYLFPVPANYPYADTFIMSLNIIGVMLLSQRYLEAFACFMLANIVAIIVCILVGITFTAILYGVLFMIAAAGLINWIRLYVLQRARTS